jgi:hypothetical protein
VRLSVLRMICGSRLLPMDPPRVLPKLRGSTIRAGSMQQVSIPLFFTFVADAHGKAGRPEEGLKQIAEATRS